MAFSDAHIEVTSIIKILDTGDRPIIVFAGDDKAYLIKHNISGHLQSNLIREWICFQLFRKLGVAIPQARLLYFNPMFFQDELRPLTGRFNEQIVFGSEWLEARDLKDEFYQGKPGKGGKLLNPAELARILIMDLWLKNNDRTVGNLNLIVSNRKLYAIDHAATFDQQSFEKLADPKRKEYFVEVGDRGELIINSSYFNYYFEQYAGEFEEVGSALCKKIDQIDTAFLNQIVQSVPSAWNLTTNEKQAIVEYLAHRKQRLEELFRGHLDFSRRS